MTREDGEIAEYLNDLSAAGMRRHHCENGVHRDWASSCSDHGHDHACPWCRIAGLEELISSQRKLLLAQGKATTGPCSVDGPQGTTCQLHAGHDGVHLRVSNGTRRTW